MNVQMDVSVSVVRPMAIAHRAGPGIGALNVIRYAVIVKAIAFSMMVLVQNACMDCGDQIVIQIAN